MNVKHKKLPFWGGVALLSIFIILSQNPLSAATRYRSSDEGIALNETRDSVDFLKHEHDNLEAELKMLSERIDNQEATISSLRQQILDANQANKDLLKNSTSNLTNKVTALEVGERLMISDIKLLKTHGNETADVLKLFKQKLSDLENITTQHSQNMDNFQIALKAMAEAIDEHGKLTSEQESRSNSGGAEIYKVRHGDSLGKIAKDHRTTVKVLKELNNLTSDKISEGQLLQLP